MHGKTVQFCSIPQNKSPQLISKSIPPIGVRAPQNLTPLKLSIYRLPEKMKRPAAIVHPAAGIIEEA